MDIINQYLDYLQDNSGKIITAFVVLVVGIIIAFILARIVGAVLRRTDLDNRLAALAVGDNNAQPPRVENAVSQTIFYLLVLASIVGFFSTLGIPQVTDPLNRFLDTVFAYLPNVFGAIALTVIAFLLANLSRTVIIRLARNFNVDDRVKKATGEVANTANQKAANTPVAQNAQKVQQKVEQTSITQVIGNTVYYLVLLVFLPAILGTLNLGGVLEPVQDMVGTIINFLPNLLGAILILVIGYFVAKIIRGFVESFAQSVGLDALAERMGIGGVGGKSLSSLAGLIVFVLVLLPVIVSGLSALQIQAITQPASDIVSAIISALPNLAAAILIILIGYVAGKVVSELARNFLEGVGFDNLLGNLGLVQVQGKVNTSSLTLSQITSKIILVYIVVLVATQALNILGLDQFTALLNEFLALSGRVLIGLVIFALGLFLGTFAHNALSGSNMPMATVMANAARIGIITVSVFMALEQSGVATNIVSYGFIIVLGTIGVTIALAVGIGGQDVARDMLNQLRNRGQRSQGSSEKQQNTPNLP